MIFNVFSIHLWKIPDNAQISIGYGLATHHFDSVRKIGNARYQGIRSIMA